MHQRGRQTRNLVIVISVLFALLIIIDRYYWAQISQWREDQATNMWLGYTSTIGHMPVGLMSSQGILNPNGMIVLGHFMSFLPNLLSVSFFLGFLQIVFILLVSWKSFGRDWKYLLLATVPALTSVVLRSTSVEYWNQFTITLLNILFVFWAVRYLQQPSLWNIPPIVILILLAPSLYLAGVANAVVMTVLTFGILLYKKPDTKDTSLIAVIILLIVLLSIVVTWLPYLSNVNFEQIKSYTKQSWGAVAFLDSLWESLFGIPIHLSTQWTLNFTLAFIHADKRILSQTSQRLLDLVGISFLLQCIFAYATFLFAMLRLFVNKLSSRDSNTVINVPALRLVIISTLFIGLSFATSAYLGAPDWLHGERPDQTVQFLPMLLNLIFLLPVTIRHNARHQNMIHRVSFILLSFFVTANMVCGASLILDHLQYHGDIITIADVPLRDKIQAIDFIAADWKSISNAKTIPVDYDLGGGNWDFVPRFGLVLTEWYPAPMTQGRSFDYEFLHRYGLTNQQEGIQLRTRDTGRYLVTYAFGDHPVGDENTRVTWRYFGRLKVYIIER
jgi:hypothetical protein